MTAIRRQRDGGTVNEPLTDEVMARVEALYARELFREEARQRRDGGPHRYDGDEIVDNGQGVGISRFGRDAGTPELQRKGAAYMTETVVNKQRRRVRRTSDLMRRMLRSRLITLEQAAAGRDFRSDFDIGHLDPRRAADLQRVPGTGGKHEDDDRAIEARDRVACAMKALGGYGSVKGKCAWWVLGAGLTIGEWSAKEIFGVGRSVTKNHGGGIIMATLEDLKRHYEKHPRRGEVDVDRS